MSLNGRRQGLKILSRESWGGELRGHEEASRKRGEKAAKCVCVRVCVYMCVWPDGSSVWRPARGTGAGHMTSRYQGDGDCSWREDERRRAPGTERGREGGREGASRREGWREAQSRREAEAQSERERSRHTVLQRATREKR